MIYHVMGEVHHAKHVFYCIANSFVRCVPFVEEKPMTLDNNLFLATYSDKFLHLICTLLIQF